LKPGACQALWVNWIQVVQGPHLVHGQQRLLEHRGVALVPGRSGTSGIRNQRLETRISLYKLRGCNYSAFKLRVNWMQLVHPHLGCGRPAWIFPGTRQHSRCTQRKGLTLVHVNA
jgi:hypothetical protein